MLIKSTIVTQACLSLNERSSSKLPESVRSQYDWQ